MTLAQQTAQRARLLEMVAEIDAELRAMVDADLWECGERVREILEGGMDV